MTEKGSETKPNFSADWLLRGALARIGDTFDRFTGRKWVPSSSLATSELIERIKKVLDAETRDIPGKGKVVPHEIKLKVQWNKFSTDENDVGEKLRNELLTATADHINDSLYYTLAPVSIEIEPDYFADGVRLTAGFGGFLDSGNAVDMNVTVTGLPAGVVLESSPAEEVVGTVRYVVRYSGKEQPLEFTAGKSISVGRSGSNELVIDDNSVSKIHASISSDAAGDLLIADTGSTNGTFLNGERIAYAKAIKIVPADKIMFGTVEVTFERVMTPEPEPTDEEAAPTIAIDGLEFTSRTSEAPVPDAVNEEPAAVDDKEEKEQ